MSRQHRHNLPGVPFHLTARAQHREAVFIGLERSVVRLIYECAPAAGVRVLAHAVMPNHLHLVAVQGGRPLGWYMQRVLRRIALVVMRARQREGHVFERRYYSAPCLDATYFRNTIAYVHLNPVRAELCAAPRGYAWTSHGTFCDVAAGEQPSARVLAVEGALRVFAARHGGTMADCRANYAAFLMWRLDMDRFVEAGGHPFSPVAPRPPMTAGGDAVWARTFAAVAAPALARRLRLPPRRPDLHRLAMQTLAEEAPELQLEWLRIGGRSRAMVRLRRLIVARALAAGHSNIRICRFLNVSSSSVSRVAALVRETSLQ
jgi:REP element-mobilizing transposase RayT